LLPSQQIQLKHRDHWLQAPGELVYLRSALQGSLQALALACPTAGRHPAQRGAEPRCPGCPSPAPATRSWGEGQRKPPLLRVQLLQGGCGGSPVSPQGTDTRGEGRG